MDMAVVPREMRRDLVRAHLQQNEDHEKVNHQMVLRLVAGRLFRREPDVLKFCVDVCPFPITNAYRIVYMRCANGRINGHSVAEVVSEPYRRDVHS